MTDNRKPVRRQSRLNPFQKLTTETDALTAAKSGVVVGGWLALSYAIQPVVVLSTGWDKLSNGGALLLAVNLFLFALACLLIWRILVRQSLWAEVLATLWLALELTSKVRAAVNRHQDIDWGLRIIYVVLIVSAILGIRGSWKLRQLRRATSL